MHCPKCGGPTYSTRSGVRVCRHCGTKSSQPSFKSDSPDEHTEFGFAEKELESKSEKKAQERSKTQNPPPQKTQPKKKSASKPRKTSPTRARKRLSEAQQYTELRRAVKDLTGKVNDLDIQVSRRVEELQAIVVRLEQFLKQLD